MVKIEKNMLVISLPSDNPKQLLNEMREGIAEVSSVLVKSDEFNYHENLPEAIAALMQLQKELFTD